MAINERQNEILRTLKESKTASVNALAKALYVSEATIRRDLAEMKSMGLIERSHGGAILPENAEEISIFFRMEKNANEKERAATKALPHIPPFKSLFIDSLSHRARPGGAAGFKLQNGGDEQPSDGAPAGEKAEHQSHYFRRQRAEQHQFRFGELDGAAVKRFFLRSDDLLLRVRFRQGRL